MTIDPTPPARPVSDQAQAQAQSPMSPPSPEPAPERLRAAGLRRWAQWANGRAGQLPLDPLLLAARAFPAMVFWQSGRTKVEGLTLRDSTWFLFEHVYALPLVPHTWAAVAATLAEHLLPVLLILGLGARFAALGLLVMTAVIQFLVFPGAWLTHGLWAVCLVLVVARGPGWLSLDRALGLEPARRRV